MAQQGQFPMYPIPNTANPYTLVPPPAVPASVIVQNSYMPPPQQQQSSLYVTGKRQRDDGGYETSGHGEERCSKRMAMQDVLFRIVMPSNLIGKVIGKEGARIRKVREETRATIKIADAISGLTALSMMQRHEERVIIISSKEGDDAVSDAENALQQIASLILKEDKSSKEVLKGHIVANTIRLLVAGTQAGSLIGACGQNIESIRNASGATIAVLTHTPLCASAHESDRVVQISGEVPAVMKALEDIGRVLRENPARQVISISPAYNLCAFRAPQQYMKPATAADYVTLEMMISESNIGGFIGKGGSNISRIRNESGATIKVYGGKGEQKHRQIHLAGSVQQVAYAKQLVDEYVYYQLMQQQIGPQQ